MDLATTGELDALASAAPAAAEVTGPEGAGELEARYRQLRDHARILNIVQRWAQGEKFEPMFPTLRAQRLFYAFDALVASGSRAPADPAAPVRRLLVNLAARASGVSHANKVGSGRKRP